MMLIFLLGLQIIKDFKKEDLLNIIIINNILKNRIYLSDKKMKEYMNTIYKEQGMNIDKTNPNYNLYMIADIGFYARSEKEIDIILKILYENNILIKDNKYEEYLFISKGIYKLYQSNDKELIDYIESNKDKISNNILKCLKLFFSISSLKEGIEKTKSYNNFIKILTFAYLFAKFPFIDKNNIEMVIDKIKEYNNSYILESFKEYIENRNYKFVELDNITSNTKILVININTNNRARKKLYFGNTSLSIINFIYYELYNIIIDYNNEDDKYNYLKEKIERLTTSYNDDICNLITNINKLLESDKDKKVSLEFYNKPIELLKYCDNSNFNNKIYDGIYNLIID